MTVSNSCCFLGHREISETEELKIQLYNVVKSLIVNKNVDTFLFGSKSQFNDLCYAVVTHLKEEYTHIKRVYVRAEYPVIDDSYRAYLLEDYEDTYYPEKLIGAGKSSYVKRNFYMIDKVRYCVVYYAADYTPTRRRSGTKLALEYAIKRKKEIFKFPI